MVQEIQKSRENILHFAENYFFIIAPDTGRQVIELHTFQRKALRMIRDNRFNILLFSRQVGKTTISTIYLLWHALFNNDQHILVVANKEETAKEIFGRVRLAFEELPNWLKPGVKEYGKEGMELANGSRIKITTTTSSAGRGSSCNVLFIDEADHVECVSGDTMITLKNTTTGNIMSLQISKAYEFAAKNNDLEVLTHQGYRTFSEIQKYSNRDAVKVTFDDGSSITTSTDHEFLCESGDFVFANKSVGNSIKSVRNSKVVESVEKLTELVDLYDVCDVEGGTYLTNDVVSHNCNLLNSFWASVFPIISSSKKSKIIMASTPRDTSGLFYRLYQKSISNDEDNVWRSMMVRWDDVPGRDEKWMRQTKAAMDDPTKWAVEFECEFEETGESAISNTIFEKMRRRCSDPQFIYMDGAYKLWDLPQSDRIYVAGVDVAEGVSKDFTVVNILDITDLRCINQVALYTSNTITPSEFTPKLHEILAQWGSPILLSERNNCGAQVVDNLRKDFNYENIVCHGARELGRSKIPLGIISHSNTKYDCVSNQRYWINTMDAVQINDIHTVDEFKDFIKYPNGAWKARPGKHDDRVMSISWALNILSDKIVNKYFEVVAQDENHKPLMLKPFDYGIKYFMNPNSMYVNEKDGVAGDALPVMFGGSSANPDMAELEEMGWRLL